MTRNDKILVCTGAIFVAVVLLTCGYFAFIVYINWPPSPIAENIAVTGEWAEITPSRPLNASHRSQYLNLRIANFDAHSSPNISEIKLPDGRVVKPEIEIYDEDGEMRNMRHSGFVRKYFDGVVFRPSGDLSSDKRYTKIRIRSDVPFTCEGIYWIDYNPK
jgi:hypothetical protein